MLLASDPYYLTNTWLLAMTTAVVAPPVVAYLHRHHWRCSIRGLLAFAVAACIGVGCAGMELWNLHRVGLYTYFVAPGEWWNPIPVVIVSSLITAVSTRSTDTGDG